MNATPRFLFNFKMLVVSLAWLALPLPLFAQGGNWIKQAPVPTGSNVMSLAAVSQNELWGVSSPMLDNTGLLVHTTDAGVTWEIIDPSSAQLDAVFFLDAQHGWAAGNNFLHTTDGGQHWVKDNDWGSIYDLFFLDELHGWACGNGGAAYWTTDGGLHWNGVATPAGATLSSIWFTDLQQGWSVAINGQIVRTSDGGHHWTLSHDTGGYLSTVQFFDASEGWAIGGDTFVHTLNGGQSWTPVAVPAGTWSHAARFSDRLHGVSVGEYGNIIVTANGGQSWTTIQPMGVGPRLWDAECVGAGTFLYSGDSGALSRSFDGGHVWHSIQSGGTGITRGIDILDGEHAWAANEGGEVLETVNGGTHWERSAVDGFDVYGQLHDIDFVNASVGWVVGTNDFFGGSDGRISGTTDGGHSWHLQLSLPEVEFFGVAALSPSTALAFGRGLFAASVLLRTTNGGLDWIPVPTAAGDFRGSYFLDSSRGWLVGSKIWITTDGGASWNEQYSAGAELSAVSFADSQDGWAVGFANQVLHTTDGGQHWTPQTIPAPPLTAFLGVTAISPTTAWVAGWNGLVARTTDGGTSWQIESIPGTSGAYFECAEFLDAENGWVAGDLGIYRRTLDGSVLVPFCFGDGSAGSCPCGNSGSPGHGCQNSAATGGSLLTAAGVASLSADTLLLTASGERPAALSIFLQGDSAITPANYGDGLRCTGGVLKRLYVKNAIGGTVTAPQAGDLSVSSRSAALGDPIPMGATRNYQVYYRDANASFCPNPSGSTFNVSNAITVVWGS